MSAFKRDVLRLLTGAGVAQIIVVAAAPVLTRLFQPEDFGILALFTAITGITGVIACLRYELAIVLPADAKEGANLFWASICIAIVMSGLFGLLVGFFGQDFAEWLEVPALAPYLWLVPVMVFAHGLQLALTNWSTRLRQFSRLAGTRVLNQATSTGGSLGAGLAGAATGGAMILATVAGQVAATLFLGTKVVREHGRLLREAYCRATLLNAVSRYRKFPLYGSWSILLGVSAWKVPLFALAYYFSPAVVGFYALGFRILQLPMNLLGEAIGKVFFQRASKAVHQGELAPLVLRLYSALTWAALLPMLVLLVTSRDLYSFVFGEDWAEAGLYVQYLAPWAFFWFLSGPLTSLFAVLDKQEVQLNWNIINLTVRTGSVVVGGMLGEPRLAVLLLGISGAVVYALKVAMTLRYSGVALLPAAGTLLRAMLFASPVVAVLIWIGQSGFSSVEIVLAAGLAVGVHLFVISKRLGIFQ